MATTTTNLGLTKPAGSEGYSVDVWNGNMDKIDTAVGKTNKSISGNTLANFQTAILAVADTMSNGEIVCGYCNPGFNDAAKGFDGSAGAYILARRANGTYIIHVFVGTSDAVGYYYSSAWHWAQGAKAVAEDITSQTNVTSGKVYLIRSGHVRQLVVVDAVLPSNSAYLTLPQMLANDQPTFATEGILRKYDTTLLFIWIRPSGTWGQANGTNGATLNGNLVWVV